MKMFLGVFPVLNLILKSMQCTVVTARSYLLLTSPVTNSIRFYACVMTLPRKNFVSI